MPSPKSFGIAGSDVFSGGDGADVLLGGEGGDQIFGGGGFNILSLGDAGESLHIDFNTDFGDDANTSSDFVL